MGSNLSIKRRFIVLGIIVILSMLLIGSYLLFAINEINTLSKEIVNSPYIISDASNLIEKNIIKIHRYMKDIILADNPIDRASFSQKINDLESEVYENLALIESHILDDTGRVLYEDVYDLFIAWKPIREEVKSLIDQGQFEAARDITTGKGAAHLYLLETELSTLSAHTKEHINEYIDDIDNKSRGIFVFIIAVFSLIVLFIAALNTFVLKGVLDSINGLNDNISNVIDNKDFRVKPVKGDNEISKLAKNFNRMIFSIGNMISNKDTLSELHSLLANQENIESMRKVYVNYLMEKTSSEYCAMYSFNEKTDKFQFEVGTPLVDSEKRKPFTKGSGLIGIVGETFNPKHINNIDKDDIILEASSMKIKPKGIYVFPIGKSLYQLQGVVELASSKGYDAKTLELIDSLSELLPPYISNLRRKEEISKILKNTEQLNNELLEKSRELEQNTKELEVSNRELEHTNEEMERINIELENQKKELLKSTRELSKANTTKSDFLANMSHELRTPLNSIILISNMLSKKESLNPKDREKIEVVKSAGNELLELINNLLDISKIESGKMEVFKEKVSTINLGQRMKKKFETTAEKRGLDFEIEDNLMVEFITDKMKLEQILNNFLSNAFKFTEEGSVRLIFDKSDLPDYSIKITVEDTGIGIREDKQQEIFEKFSQGDNSITRKFGGTGLGLAIATEMASLLNIKLTLESNLNQGSKFSIHLPTKNDDRKNNAGRRATDSWELSDDVNDSDKFILIIEDNVEFIKAIKPYINTMGFKVVAALSGYEGINKASTNKPDGIMLDLVLPDISGGRVLKELKINPATRGIPVHIMSFKDRDNEINFKKMGAVGYTQKTPNIEVDAKEVIDNITRVINKVPKSILLVEDEDLEVKSITEMLEDWNLDIDTADNAGDAIEKIRNKNYDALVLDLNLKGSSGINVCKFIKKESLTIPVIIYTAKSLNDEEYRELNKYSNSIVLKSASSKGNLLEEIAIFIHKIYDWKEGKIKVSKESISDMKGKRILLCDDDSRNIFAITSLLEDFDIKVKECYNGKEALKILSKDKDFDLILMDIMMPIMDGFEAIKEIKSRKELRSIPIIALTAKAMKGDREKCLIAGADDYMSKPVDMDLLIKLINIWVNKNENL